VTLTFTSAQSLTWRAQDEGRSAASGGEMRMNSKWLPVLVAPALTLGIVTAAPGAVATKVTISPYWAGYEANGGTTTSFKYIQATFTVPGLNCTSTTSIASQIVLLAAGNGAQIIESCQGGSPSYAAYGYSTCNGHDDPMYPTLTISPGDTIELSANGNGSEDAYDLTTGARADNPQATPCGDSSVAGVLTNANAGHEDVANFTQVGFRQIQVQTSNQASPGPLTSPAWKLANYALQGPTSRVDVKPEALLSGKYTSAFANDWFAPN
jgi:hypothetical protein